MQKQQFQIDRHEKQNSWKSMLSVLFLPVTMLSQEGPARRIGSADRKER
jgi:hypothetical protein